MSATARQAHQKSVRLKAYCNRIFKWCFMLFLANAQFGPPAARPRTFADAGAAAEGTSGGGGGGGYGVVSNWGGNGALSGVSQNTGVAGVAVPPPAVPRKDILVSANSDKPPQTATPEAAASLIPPPPAPPPVASVGTSKASAPPKLTLPPQCEPLDPLSCNKNLFEVCSFSNGTYRCICPPNFSRLPDGRCLGKGLGGIGHVWGVLSQSGALQWRMNVSTWP